MLAEAQVAPTWSVDPLMNSGESKVVQKNQFSITPTTPTAPSSFSITVTFNTAFSSAPRVIISLMGYNQVPPASAGIQLGFRVQIGTITATNFQNLATTYGANMIYLRYFYLGIAYSLTQFSIDYQQVSFPATNSMQDTTSASRSYSEIRSNIIGENYTAALPTNDIVMLIYLVGFKTDIGSTGICVKLRVEVVSGLSHRVTYETAGTAKVLEITYFRMSLDKTALTADGTRVFDSWAIWGQNSLETFEAWGSITGNTEFKYRNFLWGFKDVVISYAEVSTNGVNFMLEFRSTVNPLQAIWKSDLLVEPINFANPLANVVSLATPTYTYLYGETFHHRRPICAAPNNFYVRMSEMCVSTCPDGTFLHPTYNFCETCHSTCLTCDSAASTGCLSCDAADFRQLNSNKCECMTGYQENAALTCISSACGDGAIGLTEECDDGNRDSSDGCSKNCVIQVGHACTVYSNGNGTSLCYYAQPVTMAISTVFKILNANQVRVVLSVEAPNCNDDRLKYYFMSLQAIELTDIARLLWLKQEERQAFTVFQLKNLAVTTVQVSSVSYKSIGSGAGIANLTLAYSADVLTLRNKKFSFVSSGSEATGLLRYFHSTPPSSVALEDPYNNVPMLYYEDSVYSSVSSLASFFMVLIILGLVFLLVFIVLRRAVVPVEALLVMQFAYFSLLGQTDVQIGISSLGYYGRLSMGYNANFFPNELITCKGMGEIYQECNTFDNLNITVFLAALCLCIALFLLFYKANQQKKLDEQSDYHSSNSSSEQQRENSFPNSGKDATKQAMQDGQIYELPHKVRVVLSVCLEISFGLFFLTGIEYLVTAIYQESSRRISAIILLAFIGIFYALLWFSWFKFSPEKELSFAAIAPAVLQKISLLKVHYLGLFVLLLIWGLVLALAPGIVAYSMLIAWCGAWIFLTFRKGIYRSKYHKFRALINQIITIVIAILFIVMDIVDIGDGVAFAILLAVLLTVCLFVNILIGVYAFYTEYKNKKLLKENADDFKNYISNSGQSDRKTDMKPAEFHEQPTARKVALMESEMRSIIKQKMSELKSMRKQLMLKTPSAPSLVDSQRSKISKWGQIRLQGLSNTYDNEMQEGEYQI